MYSNKLKKHYTVDEYFRLEEHSHLRHEFYNGDVYAMAGASKNHSIITTNLIITLGNHLGSSPCILHGPDMRIKIIGENNTDFVYPDASVSCVNETNNQYIEHPKLIIEVLSKSTTRYDQIDKFRKYQKLKSLEDYVLVDQYSKRIDVYRKSEESDLKWIIQTYIGGEVFFPSIDLKSNIDEFYSKVDFDSKEK